MEEKIVSTRINKQLHDKMKEYDEVNWSAVIRRAIVDKMRQRENLNWEIDEEKARDAARRMDELAKRNVFNKGKFSKEIIREWRDKKK